MNNKKNVHRYMVQKVREFNEEVTETRLNVAKREAKQESEKYR